MELFISKLSQNKKWRRASKFFIVFFVIYLPLRIIFNLGFVNQVADAFLGLLTFISSYVLFIVFPFSFFKTIGKTISCLILVIFMLGSVFFVLLQLLLLPDIIKLGYNPDLKVIAVHPQGNFERIVQYQSDCGATCSIDNFEVKEFVFLNTIKAQIPGSTIDLPN